MEVKINSVEFDGEFRVCPSCGYKDGFHSMLRQDRGIVKWMFICPSCSEIFDVGYTVENFSDK
jgi:hypothetical protein